VTVGPPDDIGLSFHEVADVCDRVRPSYPAALFDALFETLSPGPEIVEVGPGTGQATNLRGGGLWRPCTSEAQDAVCTGTFASWRRYGRWRILSL
jgi:hypothetical protein